MPYVPSPTTCATPSRITRGLTLAVPLVALALGGCAQRWAKPGATDADFRVAHLQCESVAYQRLPPEPVWTQLSAGHFVPGHRQCWKSRGTRYCDYRPGHFVPPRFGHVDRNEPFRDRLVASCLVGEGWRPVD